MDFRMHMYCWILRGDVHPKYDMFFIHQTLRILHIPMQLVLNLLHFHSVNDLESVMDVKLFNTPYMGCGVIVI